MKLKKLKIPKEYLVLLAVFLIMLAIWPGKLFVRIQKEDASAEKGLSFIYPVTDSSLITGTFVPTYEHLDTLSFKFNLNNGGATKGEVVFTLYDSSMEVLCTDTVQVADLINGGYEPFDIHLDLSPGKTYSYSLGCYQFGEVPPLLYTGNNAIGPYEHTGLSVADTFYQNVAPDVKYVYTTSPSLKDAVPYLICVLAIGILVLIAIPSQKKKEEN